MAHSIIVEDKPPRDQVVATAGQTVFTTTFKVLDDADLKVYLTPAGQDPDDSADLLTITADYALAGTEERTVTLVSSASAGDIVTLVRDTPIARTEKLNDLGPFKPDLINDERDGVVMILQELTEVAENRAPRFNDALVLDVAQDPIPAPAGGKAMRWNADASGIELFDSPGEGVAQDRDDAQAAQAAAESLRDDYRGRYFGAYSSDPSLDLNGDPPDEFDTYYNTTTGQDMIYDGSAWVVAASENTPQSRAEDYTAGSSVTTEGLAAIRAALGAGHIREWTARTAAAANIWLSIAWSPELGLFAAVSYDGTGNRVMTSPDGINWTSRTSAADNTWRAVCWSPERSLFVAVASSGTGNRVMTSPDGINWTSRTSAADNAWYTATWSPDLGLFAAVAASGTGNRVMTSPDGVNWTIRTSAADNQWRSVAWSPELGLFVAVSSTGTGNRVMTSPDGINWTSRTSAADNDWYAVAWSPELGLFAAVAISGTGNRVMTSPDGINWTLRASAADNNWTGIAWSPELGLFAAVAASGTGDRIMTSPDGINWTLRASASDLGWYSVAWSPELGLFAAVATSGTDSVMTSK